MARIADGDRDAIEPLYAALWPPVRALALRTVGERAADDVAQTALLMLFRQADRYREGHDALRWALALATWECRTERQRVRRRRSAGPVSDEPRDEASPSPEEAFLAREALAQLEAASRELSSTDREVLERAAAGEALDATGRKRKQRALTRLRARLRLLFQEEIPDDA